MQLIAYAITARISYPYCLPSLSFRDDKIKCGVFYDPIRIKISDPRPKTGTKTKTYRQSGPKKDKKKNEKYSWAGPHLKSH